MQKQRPPQPSKNVQEELESLRKANKTFIQKQHAKDGEISYLRRELSKKTLEIEKGRQEREKILKDKERDLKALDASRKKEIEAIKSDNTFLKRDFEKVSEDLQKFTQQGSNGDNRQNGVKRRMNESFSVQTPFKKPKIGNKGQKAPTNIDE